jgi:hypothetical protein
MASKIVLALAALSFINCTNTDSHSHSSNSHERSTNVIKAE